MNICFIIACVILLIFAPLYVITHIIEEYKDMEKNDEYKKNM